MPAAIPVDRILDAVLDVIAEHGFAEATTARMAQAAGTSEMTLFRRFGGKAGLLTAALALEARRFSARGISYTGDVDDDLVHIVEAYEDLLRRRGRMVFAFFLEAPKGGELRAAANVPLQAIGAVVEMMQRYQMEGRLKQGSPWTATLDLLSPLIVKAMLATAQPTLRFDDDARAYVANFLHGWKA